MTDVLNESLERKLVMEYNHLVNELRRLRKYPYDHIRSQLYLIRTRMYSINKELELLTGIKTKTLGDILEWRGSHNKK